MTSLPQTETDPLTSPTSSLATDPTTPSAASPASPASPEAADEDGPRVVSASGLNWLRAGVLGANDGIVSVAATVLGVAGATSDVKAIFIAGIAALEGPQDEAVKMVKAFDARRKVVVEELNKLPGVSCVEPGGAFYAFPNITRTGLKAKEFEKRLLDDAGVTTVAGTSFGSYGEGYLRLSYANSTENIREAIGRMDGWLRRLPKAAE